MITPLNIKTEYSLLKSMIKIDDLINYALKNNLTVLNITDDNMNGVMEFYNKCLKNNIKPIIGLEVKLDNFNFILYAKNFNGYKNLLKITSNEKNYELLDQYSHDLICIIPFESKEIYDKLSKIFDEIFFSFKNKEENYLIEEENKLYMHQILYLNEEDEEYIKYLYAIKDNLKEPFDINLKKLYIENELANENNKYVNDICDVKIEYEKNLLPIYPCPDNMDSFSYLKKLCIDGLKRIFGSSVGSLYQERLKYELNIINKMGFCNYFLVVQDYVKYAKENGILVGAGRGSAAGSLVAYLLNITEIDPLKYNLLFERFLNPERITMPDIDTDFPDIYRGQVIDYVKEKYGEKRVGGIITFGTMAAKLVLRDVGRVLNVTPKVIDSLCKYIPNVTKLKLKDFYNENIEFKNIIDSSDKLTLLYEISCLIEGFPRHTSTHAAGVVMSRIDLDE